MHIAIIAPGSRGDVQPYIALGKGLVAAGHVVRLVTHEDFETLVRSHGVDFWPIKGNVQAIAQGAAMSARLEQGNFVAVMAQMAKEAERGAPRLAEAGLAACRGADLVLVGLGGLFVGFSVAEKLALPILQAYYIPLTPTRAAPSFLLPQLPAWVGSVVNRASYRVAQQMMWQGFRTADRRARREVLGLPPAPFFGPYGAEAVRDGPVLYGYSPAVIPKPDDWRDNIHVTGYWFLDEAEDWTPPPDLVAFLEAGPPPVYVGFGSMSSRKPAETAGLILEALDRTEQRAVLLSGWGCLRTTDLPDSVRMVEGVPFSWLFPRCAAVVHHGGAGTTSAGLRAGVPSVVVPFFGDQPFWGRRVAVLGVGSAPISRRRLTTERLSEAIQQAVTDHGMRERAATLGAIIRAEDGVARAVAQIEQIAAGGQALIPHASA